MNISPTSARALKNIIALIAALVKERDQRFELAKPRSPRSATPVVDRMNKYLRKTIFMVKKQLGIEQPLWKLARNAFRLS